MPKVDWSAIGYLDYPSARHYPYRDTNSLTNETAYINGWNRAQKEEQCSDPDSEFGKDTFAAHYFDIKKGE